MKKFEELTGWSQMAAIDALKSVIIQDHLSRGDIDRGRIEYFSHSIREAFASLESERPEVACDEIHSDHIKRVADIIYSDPSPEQKHDA